LVHSTAEYCTTVWCHSAHTRFIDPDINEALRIVSRCLHPTRADNLPIPAGIQPAELRGNGAHCLYQAVPWGLDTCSIQRSPVNRVRMHGALNRDTHLHPKHNYSSVHLTTTTYVRRSGRITNGMQSGRTIPHAFSSPTRVPTPPGMTLPRTAWVKLNRLRTGVGRFRSCLYKWGMVSSAACECGAEEQTVDHVVLQFSIHRPPHGLHGLTVLDDETTEWLLTSCPEI